MLIVTVAASLSEFPSLTLKVKLSLVAESDVLVYVAVLPSNVTLPFEG